MKFHSLTHPTRHPMHLAFSVPFVNWSTRLTFVAINGVGLRHLMIKYTAEYPKRTEIVGPVVYIHVVVMVIRHTFVALSVCFLEHDRIIITLNMTGDKHIRDHLLL